MLICENASLKGTSTLGFTFLKTMLMNTLKVKLLNIFDVFDVMSDLYLQVPLLLLLLLLGAAFHLLPQ